MKRTQLLLGLDDQGLTVCQIEHSACRQLAHFEHGEESEDALRRLLQQWPAARLHLLVDLGTETFQLCQLPNLGRRDRNILLQRRLEQHFPQTPYRHARHPSRGSTPDNATWLLCALNDRQRLDALLALLMQEKCALAGIHSVALASEDLLAKFPHVATAQCLLVTPATKHALRHSYFSRGKLIFSRLTALPAGTEFTDATATEIRRTWQFLNSEQQLNREWPLDMVLLTDRSSPPLLAEHLARKLQTDSSPIRVHHLDTAGLCRIMKQAPQDSWHGLLGSTIARGLVRDHYRPAAAGGYHRLLRLGRLLQHCASCLLIACTLLSLWLFHEGRARQEDGRKIERALLHEYERKRELDARLAAQQTDPALPIAEVAALYRRHLANWPEGEITAKAISRIWSDFPLLQLDRFDWQAVDAQAPASESSLSSNCGPAQRIALAGQFAPELAPRQIQAELQRLSNTLGRQLGGRMEIVSSPLNVSSRQPVSHDGRDREGTNFLLRLHLPPSCGARA